MKADCYLVLTKTKGVTDMKKNKPRLYAGQIAVKLNLDLSDHFFDQYIPEITLTVPDSYIQRPSVEVELKGGAMSKLTGRED